MIKTTGYIVQSRRGGEHFHGLDTAKLHADRNAPATVWHSIDVTEMHGTQVSVLRESHQLYSTF